MAVWLTVKSVGTGLDHALWAVRYTKAPLQLQYAAYSAIKVLCVKLHLNGQTVSTGNRIRCILALKCDIWWQ